MPPGPRLPGPQGLNYTDLPGESAGHAVGRSRGGWTSRIHALADQACSLTTLQLTVGRTGNNHALAPLLAAYHIEHQGSRRLSWARVWRDPVA